MPRRRSHVKLLLASLLILGNMVLAPARRRPAPPRVALLGVAVSAEQSEAESKGAALRRAQCDEGQRMR
jgi:hypothetical protein